MTPTPTLREALEEARQHVEFIADGGVESVAQLRAAIDLLPRIDAALSTPEPQGWRPIAEARMVSDFLHDSPDRCLVYGEMGVAMGRAWRYPGGEPCAQAAGFNGEWKISHWMPLPEPPK